jgi:hypothetical protein
MSTDKNQYTPRTETDDIEIFGTHKSREEIKAEEKARKQAEREALRREIAARRAARKEGTATSRQGVWSVVVVMVAILALAVATLAIQFTRAAKTDRFAKDDTRATYFLAADATPDMEQAGITAAVSEVYYTKGGYLCVKLALGNGADTAMKLEAVDVVLYNKEEQQIASGYAATRGDLIVAAKGYEKYTFYISPEHITITDDPLTDIDYTTNITGSPVTDTTTE